VVVVDHHLRVVPAVVGKQTQSAVQMTALEAEVGTVMALETVAEMEMRSQAKTYSMRG
jgi:hypothetical protein